MIEVSGLDLCKRIQNHLVKELNIVARLVFFDLADPAYYLKLDRHLADEELILMHLKFDFTYHDSSDITRNAKC